MGGEDAVLVVSEATASAAESSTVMRHSIPAGTIGDLWTVAIILPAHEGGRTTKEVDRPSKDVKRSSTRNRFRDSNFIVARYPANKESTGERGKGGKDEWSFLLLLPARKLTAVITK